MAIMNNRFYENFFEMEIEKSFFDYTYNGVNYWEIMRSWVFLELWSKAYKTDPVVAPYKIKIANYSINMKEIKNYFMTKQTRNIDVLLISQPRRFKQGKYYENLFIDSVEEILKDDYKCCILEEPSYSAKVPIAKAHLQPIKCNNIYFTDFFEIKFMFKKFFFKKICKKEMHEIEQKYEQLKKTIVESYSSYNLEGFDFKETFMDTLLRIKLTYSDIKSQIEKLNPKIVLVYYFPTPYKMMMLNICGKKGIPTVEIQHGIISKYDTIINKFNDITKLTCSPKYFFGFGEANANQYKFNVVKENIYMVGYPFLEKKLTKKIEKPSFIQKNVNYILVISQSTIGTEIGKFVEQLSDRLIDNDKYKIIFKYHPNELTKAYDNLDKKNIIKVKSLDIDIYTLQKFCLVQIGVSSTALYEGLSFGLPTIILDKIETADEVKEGLQKLEKGVYFESNPNEVKKIVLGKLVKPLAKDITLFWQKNSENRIKRGVRDILDKEN